MRRDLVGAVLDAASAALFEDVVYTRPGHVPVTVEKSIAGVRIAAEQFDQFGQPIRSGTHSTRALLAKFPDLARGDTLDDGTVYTVLDFRPVGDGRFEIEISLAVA